MQDRASISSLFGIWRNEESVHALWRLHDKAPSTAKNKLIKMLVFDKFFSG